jgi:N-acetylglutamate synthase-like GNAT family acetyltransferase
MPPSQQPEIRRAAPEDSLTISNLLRESFAAFEPLYTANGFNATLRDGQVFGTVAIVVKGKSGYIRGMAVLPSARGVGIGAQLLQHVENWARDQQCVRLLLSTTPFLSEAIRLYERFGFQRTDEGPSDLFGTRLFTMAKTISMSQ